MSRVRPKPTDAISRLGFAAILGLIIVGAAIVRLPGLSWEQGLGERGKGLTFHIDEWTFVEEIRHFDHRSPTGKGYVRGWTTHGYVLEQLGYRLLKLKDVDIIALLRRLSLAYSLLTIMLLAVTGAALFGSRELGLWAAALLALSGLHVINSHFGTADAAATAYGVLGILLAGVFGRTKSDWALLGLGVTVGAALAIKFQLSLLPLAAWVCWRSEQHWLRLTQVMLVSVAAFQLFSLFNYTPWEMQDFAQMLRNSVHLETEPRLDLLYVFRKLIPGLGFGASLLLLAGGAALAGRARRVQFKTLARRLLASPWLYVMIPAACQYAMVAEMDLRSGRQVLVLVPAACLVAARGILWLRHRFSTPPAARFATAALVLILGYQTWYVWALGSWYTNDPRFAASQWLSAHVQPGERVTAHLWYSRVPGAYPLVEEPAEYILTSSLEYNRYLETDRPEAVYHSEGPSHWAFWKAIFGGRLDYERVQTFPAPAMPLEAWMQSSVGWPRDLGTFVPREVVIFKKKRGA